MMHGPLLIAVVARVANMTCIVECNKVPNTSVQNAGILMIFGLSPMAIAAVAENMKCCKINKEKNHG